VLARPVMPGHVGDAGSDIVLSRQVRSCLARTGHAGSCGLCLDRYCPVVPGYVMLGQARSCRVMLVILGRKLSCCARLGHAWPGRVMPSHVGHAGSEIVLLRQVRSSLARPGHAGSRRVMLGQVESCWVKSVYDGAYLRLGHRPRGRACVLTLDLCPSAAPPRPTYVAKQIPVRE
jgi:hypothetical protein